MADLTIGSRVRIGVDRTSKGLPSTSVTVEITNGDITKIDELMLDVETKAKALDKRLNDHYAKERE